MRPVPGPRRRRCPAVSTNVSRAPLLLAIAAACAGCLDFDALPRQFVADAATMPSDDGGSEEDLSPPADLSPPPSLCPGTFAVCDGFETGAIDPSLWVPMLVNGTINAEQ